MRCTLECVSFNFWILDAGISANTTHHSLRDEKTKKDMFMSRKKFFAKRSFVLLVSYGTEFSFIKYVFEVEMIQYSPMSISVVSPWSPLCSQGGRVWSKRGAYHRADDVSVCWSAAVKPWCVKWKFRHLVNTVMNFCSSLALIFMVCICSCFTVILSVWQPGK